MSRLIPILLLFPVTLAAPVNASAATSALGGHCVVCLAEAGKLVPGTDEFAVTFDRQRYLFPSAKERDLFAADPLKYAPALGGDCVVCKVEMGARMAGTAEHALKHDGRLYLFPSAKEQAMFTADPNKYAAADIALAGYCAVCVSHAQKWVQGNQKFISVYDGMRYLFPSAAEQEAFASDPAAFVPALGGDCIVCWKDAGNRVAGSVDHSAAFEGRVYLFPSDMEQKKFLANPKRYLSADVALDGNCIVCQVNAGKTVAGSDKFASVYQGFRYLFPSAQERDAFDSDPAKYVAGVQQGAAPAAPAPGQVHIVGTTACAGCAYGRRPIGDPQSLGLAVVTAEKVYIVEGAEQNYPAIYSGRFGGLTVELTGSSKREEGRFVWVTPADLKQTR